MNGSPGSPASSVLSFLFWLLWFLLHLHLPLLLLLLPLSVLLIAFPLPESLHQLDGIVELHLLMAFDDSLAFNQVDDAIECDPRAAEYAWSKESLQFSLLFDQASLPNL